jgi:hypothetical protein
MANTVKRENLVQYYIKRKGPLSLKLVECHMCFLFGFQVCFSYSALKLDCVNASALAFALKYVCAKFPHFTIWEISDVHTAALNS